MIENKELFDWLNNELLSCIPAVKYAQENIKEIISRAYQDCVRKVYTTLGYDLGIACPSLINHRVIGGHKKGRVVKEIPQNANYCEIGYNQDDAPLYFKMINTFGTQDTYFFFDYGGSVWAMEMEMIAKSGVYRSVSPHKIKKYQYDDNKRVKFYAEMYAPHKSFGEAGLRGNILVNVYEYPEDEEKPIICHLYDYAASLSENPDAGTNDNTMKQFSDYLYEITPDLKTITEYIKNKEEEFIFSRQIVSGSKKSSKPKASPDSFVRFSEWLDQELEKEIPDSGGIYFDLFEPTEDGFGIYFCVTKEFNADDDEWACYVNYSSDQMFMVQTSGLLEWENALSAAVKLIKKYLREGKYKSVLRKYAGIGTSFADSDIEYIYVKKK